MNNPPDPRPVYEYDQVITIPDLMAIRNGYIFRYSKTKWYEYKRRWMFRVGLGLCNELLHWMYHGKPMDGVKCKGGTHGA